MKEDRVTAGTLFPAPVDARSGMVTFRSGFVFRGRGCVPFSRCSGPLVQSIFPFLEVKKMDDSSYMALAVELAERGVGWVSPNPLDRKSVV